MKKEVGKERIGITIDKELLKKLDEFCKKNYSAPRSSIIERAVEEFLEGKK